jgi:hypothetical protein
MQWVQHFFAPLEALLEMTFGIACKTDSFYSSISETSSKQHLLAEISFLETSKSQGAKSG